MNDKHITVAVTGGIAAYKAVELVRALQTAGLDPHVVLTRAARNFITPLTFAAITGHRVITSLWSEDDTAEPNENSAIDHIDVAQTTRALVIAPATAHTLARLAHGLADDFLSTLYLATTAPVILAPAMNVNMWNHPATQANLEILKARGAQVVLPDAGYLACGMVGPGRLADPEPIVAAVLDALAMEALQPTTHDLAAETILITAGGTREPLDPVRFLGNRSSGKMAYALATAAAQRGARVLLVTTTDLPTPAGCEVIPVQTAEEMRIAVLDRLAEATIVIKTAAVADFRPAHPAPHKLKRDAPLTLTLEPTPDIAREVALRRRPGTLLIAFAAELADPAHPTAALTSARAKLASKGADALFLNDIANPDTTFGSPANAGTWITPTTEIPYPTQPKSQLAHHLLSEIQALRHQTLRP